MIVCAALSMVKARVTSGAALYEELPAWCAVTEQLPAASRLSDVPVTVQSPVEVNVTASPDVAVAVNVRGPVPKVWLPGFAKVIVWFCLTTPTVTTGEVKPEIAAVPFVVPLTVHV